MRGSMEGPMKNLTLSITRCSQPGQSLLVGYLEPRTGRMNDEYISLQMPTELAEHFVNIHKAYTDQLSRKETA
jgi:hypothetical protein